MSSLVGDVDDPLPPRGGQQGLVVLQPGLQLGPQGGRHGDGGTLHLQQTCKLCLTLVRKDIHSWVVLRIFLYPIGSLVSTL